MKTVFDRILEHAQIEVEREIRRKQRLSCDECAKAIGDECRRLCLSQKTIELLVGKCYEQKPDLI